MKINVSKNIVSLIAETNEESAELFTYYQKQFINPVFKKRREYKKGTITKRCPHCDFVAVNGTGLSAHCRKKHVGVTSPF